MERNNERFGPRGRKDGKPRQPKPIKHVVSDAATGVKFEVYALRDLTDEEVAAEISAWMGEKTMKDLTPWRTYRIQTDHA